MCKTALNVQVKWKRISNWSWTFNNKISFKFKCHWILKQRDTGRQKKRHKVVNKIDEEKETKFLPKHKDKYIDIIKRHLDVSSVFPAILSKAILDILSFTKAINLIQNKLSTEICATCTGDTWTCVQLVCKLSSFWRSWILTEIILNSREISEY